MLLPGPGGTAPKGRQERAGAQAGPRSLEAPGASWCLNTHLLPPRCRNVWPWARQCLGARCDTPHPKPMGTRARERGHFRRGGTTGKRNPAANCYQPQTFEVQRVP